MFLACWLFAGHFAWYQEGNFSVVRVRLPLARKFSNSTARPAAFGYSPESRSPVLCTSPIAIVRRTNFHFQPRNRKSLHIVMIITHVCDCFYGIKFGAANA